MDLMKDMKKHDMWLITVSVKFRGYSRYNPVVCREQNVSCQREVEWFRLELKQFID